MRAKGLLAQADCFDAAFFNFSPREASLMDPQQRVFLECAWTALEDAGYAPRSCEGAVSVFAGSILSSYLLQNLWPNQALMAEAGTFQAAVGNDPTFLASRVAYHLGLHGASVSVGTACSTSLVAVHLACQSLLTHESDLALAGAVSIHLPLVTGYRYENGSILSPDGHCRPFDADARGTVSSDGVGVVVLKRLDDALRDRDCIQAVIRGSGINNDGSVKVGYTAPGEIGQTRVIAEALAVAGVEPDSIALVETHGAATPLGDPIEAAALLAAFGESGGKHGFCALGSVKSNLGHLDAAAGIAGFMKAALAVRHGEIPPTLHFRRPNPQLRLEESPFYINHELRPMPADRPRRAGVSSFGIGGTNVHVVLEAPPEAEAGVEPARPLEALMLSARTASALDVATARLADHLERHPELDLADVAHTLRRGREFFAHRRVAVCRDRADAVSTLRGRDSQRVLTGVFAGDKRSVSFLFPGLGDHYVGMGWELYCAEPVFRQTVDRCAEHLRGHLEGDIRDFLYPGRGWSTPVLSEPVPAEAGDGKIDLRAMMARSRGGQPSAASADLPAAGQTGIFVTEVALTELLKSWGIVPDAMLGHSIGEFSAAYAAGVFSLPDALEIVAARGQLIQSRVGPGVMMAVPLTERDLLPLLPTGLSLGAVNGTAVCIVSGVEDDVRTLEARLAEREIRGQRLRTTHAYHSRLMEPIVAPLEDLLRKFRLRAPHIPYLSCITGQWITDEEATSPRYWARHLCRTVRFQSGLAKLLSTAGRILLEVGPGQGLTSHATQERSRLSQRDALILPTMRWSYGRESELAVLLRGAGQLWLAGYPVDPARFLGGGQRRRVPLPGYPFERQRYWIDPPAATEPAPGADAPQKTADISRWFYLPRWQPSARPHGPSAGGQVEHWLIFVDEGGIGDDLTGRLRKAGQKVTIVRQGKTFADAGESITINSGESGQYDELAAGLACRGAFPSRVVHLWTYAGAEMKPPSLARFGRCQEVGYHSVMRLLKSLLGESQERALRLEIVTSQLVEVDRADRVVPEKASLRAPTLVAPQEHPGLVCRVLDFDPLPTDAAECAAVGARLYEELRHEANDPVVAYRRGRRWTQAYEPITLAGEPPSPYRTRGVYLLTGGLGGVG